MFVNHVTTNPFFTATQYGIADACNLWLHVSVDGVEHQQRPQMVTAFNQAITAGADGIAAR